MPESASTQPLMTGQQQTDQSGMMFMMPVLNQLNRMRSFRRDRQYSYRYLFSDRAFSYILRLGKAAMGKLVTEWYRKMVNRRIASRNNPKDE